MHCKRTVILCLVLSVVLMLSACGAKPNVTEDDLVMFQDMLDETASVWWNSGGISSSEATMSQIINEYVLSSALPWDGLYSYYCDREHEDVEWLYQREDPLHRFEYGAFALDAGEAEWIITKVFNTKFDPDTYGEEFYFHEDNLYIRRELGLGGGSWINHTVSEVRTLSEQKYEIDAVAELYIEEDIVEWSKQYHFVVQLQEDSNKGRYWAIEEFSQEAH